MSIGSTKLIQEKKEWKQQQQQQQKEKPTNQPTSKQKQNRTSKICGRTSNLMKDSEPQIQRAQTIQSKV